jgi:hypothetical protein
MIFKDQIISEATATGVADIQGAIMADPVLEAVVVLVVGERCIRLLVRSVETSVKYLLFLEMTVQYTVATALKKEETVTPAQVLLQEDLSEIFLLRVILATTIPN